MPISDALSSAGRFVREIFDPRVSSNIRASQMDSLQSFLKKHSINPDQVKDLGKNIKTLTDPRKSRDNSILKAVGRRLGELQDEVKALGRAKSSIKKEVIPETVTKKLFKTEAAKLGVDNALRKAEKELRLLKAEKAAFGRGVFPEQGELDALTSQVGSLKDKSSWYRSVADKTKLQIRMQQDKSARTFDQKIKPLEAKISKKEDKIKELRDNLRFDVDDHSDLSLLGEVARSQEKLKAIGKRRLIAGGAIVGGASIAANLTKDSALKSRLNSYLRDQS